MWMVEDAQQGRISKGRSGSGDLPDRVTLTFAGKRVYQLQKFLEEEIAKGGDLFRVRWLVLACEDLREAVARFNQSQERNSRERLRGGIHRRAP